MKKYVLDPQSAAHELTVQVLLKVDEAFYRMHRTKEREYQLANGTISGAYNGKHPTDFELKLSKLIAIWRDIMLRYEGDPQRQEALLMELLNKLRHQILP